MAFVEVNGFKLYYRQDGNLNGHPVVLIAGLGSDHRRWEELVSLLPKQYCFLTFDNRDSGQTDQVVDSYGIKEMTLDVVALMGQSLLSMMALTTYNLAASSASGRLHQPQNCMSMQL